MHSESQSANVPQDFRSARDGARTTDPCTIHDLRHLDMFVIDARPTR